MGFKTFYIGEYREDPKKNTVMLEEHENVLYDIFKSQKTRLLLKYMVIFMKKQKSHVG